MHSASRLLRLLLFCAILAWPVLAQVPTGAIRGTVTDPSSATITGAAITIKNKGTGGVRNATTDSVGQFQVGNLTPGEYEVRVTMNGFKTVTQEVTVQVGENLTTDFALEVGRAGETVIVTGETPAINTTDFKIDGVVSRQQIESLPLNGRNFLQLAMLEPGVEVQAVENPGTSPNNFFRVSIAGASQTMTRISVDGATINDRVTGGTAQNFSQETVQEFQISTFNFDLSTSVTSVGSVNVVSRSGTNDFHGSAFMYFRDHNMAAFPGFARDPRRATNKRLEDPFFARRQAGGSVGGPVKKDRLFWFFNFENNNQDGVFVVNNNHSIFSQYDNITLSPLTARQANGKLDWKVSDKHTAFLRVSTDNNDNFNPGGTARMPSNWIYTRNVAAQGLGGLTSIFTPALVNDLRYSYGFYSAHLETPTADQCPDPVLCLGLGGAQIRAGGSFRIGANDQTPQNRFLRTYQLTDTLSWNKGAHRLRFGGEWEHFYGVGAWAFAEPAVITLHDPVTIYTRAFPTGGGAGDPTAIAIYNSLPASLKVVSTDGNRTFRPLSPGALPTVADLLQLPLNSFTTGIGNPGQPPPFNRESAARNDRFRFFAQDSWRVKPNFTFSYGMAYVYETKLLNHDLDRPAILSALLGGDLSAPKRDKNNFDPSVGFAWDVAKDGKTVIRGGGGIYHDSNVFWTRLQERALVGPSGNGRAPIPGSLVSLPNVGALNFPTPGPFRGANLVPILPAIRANLNSLLGDGTNLAVRGVEVFKTGSQFFDPNTVIGYAGNVTIGVQREVARNLVVQADFVMRRSVHFGGLNDIFQYDRNRFDRRRVLAVNPTTGNVTNAPDPVIPLCTSATQARDPKAVCSQGAFNVYESSANYRYTALHVKVDRRFSDRYLFVGSYALAKFTGFNGVINFNDLFAGNGYIGSDRRHRFTFSGIVDLPEFRGQSRLLRGLLNTWQVSLISQTFSGRPLNVNLGLDLDGDGISSTPIPGAAVNSFGRTVNAKQLRELVAAFNADVEAKTRPAIGANGQPVIGPNGQPVLLRPRTNKNEVINPIVLPETFANDDSFISQDVRLTRIIKFRERYRIHLIGEVFNLFNIANNDGYDSGLYSGRFGQPSRRYAQVFGTGIPRAFQIAARFQF